MMLRELVKREKKKCSLTTCSLQQCSTVIDDVTVQEVTFTNQDDSIRQNRLRNLKGDWNLKTFVGDVAKKTSHKQFNLVVLDHAWKLDSGRKIPNLDQENQHYKQYGRCFFLTH